MDSDESTRRSFLGAVAAAGGAALIAGGGASAAEASALPGAGKYSAGRAVRAYPAPSSGTRYTLITGDQFTESNSGLAITFDRPAPGDLIGGQAGLFRYHLAGLPQGARITEVLFAHTRNATYGGLQFAMYRWVPGSLAIIALANTSMSPQQNTEQSATVPIADPVSNWIVDNSAAVHTLEVGSYSGQTYRLNSVRVGWIPAATPAPSAALGFYPLAPKRVYDSRRPTGGGPLAAGSSRVVSVKDGYINDSDTLDVPNVVPVGAKAIAYNLTIVSTTGAGYLSVGPGDAAAAAGSAINWGGPDQVLANGLTVTLDASRQIKVFAGPGGGTQFLVDVMGYYA